MTKKNKLRFKKNFILSWEENMSLVNNFDIYAYFGFKFVFAIGRYKVSFKDPAYENENEKRLVVGFEYRTPDEERDFYKEAYDNGIKKELVSAEIYKTSEDYYKRMNYNDKINYKTSESGVVVEYLEIDFDPKTAIKSVLLHPSSSKIQQKGIERMLKTKEIDAKVSISKKPFRAM